MVDRLLPPALARRAPFALFVLLTALGVARIVSTYRGISQTSDEAPNIACGMQWLDRGEYTYGPFHPPLARIAMAIGPYIYGARSQGTPERWGEGNAVLNSAKRPMKALAMARLGILPFFILACSVVWFWARRLLGDWGALAPLFLFTNLPPVLGHAGVATSDMAVAAGVSAAVFAWVVWLERPYLRRSVLLGLACAAALLAKFSSVLLVPLCFVVLSALSCRRIAAQRRARMLLVAALVAFVAVWSAYRFSWGHMKEHVVEDAAAQGGIWRKVPPGLLRTLETAPLPAPEILDGMWQVHNHVDAGHAAYLLGRNSDHGWWYFFPVALGVKTPFGFLLLAGAGVFVLFKERWRKFDWRWWAPPAAAAVILAACIPSTLNIGVRYVLPLYPMLAIVAGIGAIFLLGRRNAAWKIVSIGLMLWTAISSAAAHPDYLAYFNELAGSRPERILVDSDLDWGQDMRLLARELKQRNVQSLYMRCLYTGDDRLLDLPSWEGLDPYRPVKGWVAVSFTMLKTYGWVAAREQGRTDNAFAWLDKYQPVTRVGKSILLYYIP